MDLRFHAVGAMLVTAALLAATTACRPPPTRPPTSPPQAPGTFATLTPVVEGDAAVPVDLSHVACGSPTFCVAVPDRTVDDRQRPLRWGEGWDGTRWSPIPAPGTDVRRLACAGSWCLALSGPGLNPDEPATASVWDGRAWIRRAAPEGLEPEDLTCWAADACVVVGRSGDREVALRGNGSSWIPVDDSRTATGSFAAAECRAADDCWFIGEAPATGARTLERWNGSTWSVVPVDVRIGDDLNCTTTRDLCVVTSHQAGNAGYGLVALRGPAGTPEQVLPTDARVSGVDCGGDGCVITTADATLVYDGTAPPTVGPGRGGDTAGLIPIVCAATNFCTYLADTGLTRRRDPRRPPLLPTWDGRTWTDTTAAPNPTEPRSALTSVSCTAPDECLAVGRAVEGTRHVGLAERWDGRRWALAPAPPAPDGHHLDLRTVSCSAPTHCVAVGATVPVEENPPVTEHLYGGFYLARFDGRTWTDETAGLPPNDAPWSALTDVDCTGTTCIAVGVPSGQSDPTQAFPFVAAAYVSTGPGAGWSETAGPPVGGNGAYGGLPGRYWLQIDCAGPTSCASTSLMVGLGVGSFTSYWDGTRWTIPQAPGTDPRITGDPMVAQGVSCPAPGRCVATGLTFAPSGEGGNAAVLRWNGTAWAAEPAPGIGGLGLVSCPGVARCLAIDSLVYGPNDLRDSAVRDARGWHRVPGAPAAPHDATGGGIPPALSRGMLADVSCTPTMCLVVGTDGDRPVAYRYAF